MGSTNIELSGKAMAVLLGVLIMFLSPFAPFGWWNTLLFIFGGIVFLLGLKA